MAAAGGGRLSRRRRPARCIRRWWPSGAARNSISAVEREVIVGFVEATQIRTTAAAYLARTRVSMTSDKAQKAFATWFKASGEVRAGAQILGLDRRQRTVPDLAAVLSGDE